MFYGVNLNKQAGFKRYITCSHRINHIQIGIFKHNRHATSTASYMQVYIALTLILDLWYTVTVDTQSTNQYTYNMWFYILLLVLSFWKFWKWQYITTTFLKEYHLRESSCESHILQWQNKQCLCMCVCSVNSLHTHQQCSNVTLIIGVSLLYYTLCFWERCSNDSLMLCIVSYHTQTTACPYAEYTVCNRTCKIRNVGTPFNACFTNCIVLYYHFTVSSNEGLQQHVLQP